MAVRQTQTFHSIRSEGGLLPETLLRRVVDAADRLPGTTPDAYGLPPGERLNEIITQSWNRLRRYWISFQTIRDTLPPNEPGTHLTNERWTLPLLRELQFGVLAAGAGPDIDGKRYPVSRFFAVTPIHLIGCGLPVDKRSAGQRGAAAAHPHSLVQEFLNRSPEHLWAIVSNGLRLRILRDNHALSRQSFLEFDLETMFNGEIYSDFVIFWLTAHATRFVPAVDGRPDTCLLEQWTREARERGARALGDLRGGVERALQTLGRGFTEHAANTALREALRTGKLTPNGFHGLLLRVIYRLIFLFVAEDRMLDGQPLLHPPDDSEQARTARQRYADYYSAARLRKMAGRIRGSRHSDLWRQFRVVAGALSGDPEYAAASVSLALPALGGFLWNTHATGELDNAELSNADFLETLRHLAWTRHRTVFQPVDYRNLGAEELGGVYESLLGLTPRISADGAYFTFAEFAGNERRTSGSYYTPDELVQSLLDTALDPVVERCLEHARKTAPHDRSHCETAENALLSLKIVDPAVGSGHFLVGAARRLARHLAGIRAVAGGDSEPTPLQYQQALRDVIGRCLYGVDSNPMAAELCRVGLWLEAMTPGKPLSFLDHHIQVGNSLLGATPQSIQDGLPDAAFKPIAGDDRNACAELKRQNRADSSRLGTLFAEDNAEMQMRLAEAAAALDDLPDECPEDVWAKEAAYQRHTSAADYRLKKRVADAWCAAFVIKKQFARPNDPGSAQGITQGHIDTLAEGGFLPDDWVSRVDDTVRQYRFFHWHLAFPKVYAGGGFDCVLGNPPWERVKLQEKEWFAGRSPEIANAPNAAARKRLIAALETDDPELYREFRDALRQAEGASHFLRNSGLYPLCGRGDINLYTVFAEKMRVLLNDHGRFGSVLPTGIATDDTTKHYFQNVIETQSLVSLYDFENRAQLFPDVDSRMKFCLFTAGSGRVSAARSAAFVFFAHSVEDLNNVERRFQLSPNDIVLLNPNTRTCPIFRSRRDAELTKAIYRRVPVLIREAHDGEPEQNPWGIRFSTMFHMSNDSHLFRTREQLESDGWRPDGNLFRRDDQVYVPLYEAKMASIYDHRAARIVRSNSATIRQAQPEYFDLIDHQAINKYATPLYWVSEIAQNEKTPDLWNRKWTLGWRRVSSTTNERTFLFSVLPYAGYGDSIFLLYFPDSITSFASKVAELSSYVFDYVVRQKMGGLNLSFYLVSQLNSIKQEQYLSKCQFLGNDQSINDWLLPRVLELTYTAWDMEPFARDCGYDGLPFEWNEERRFMLRCELDAAFFHLYLPGDRDGKWKPASRDADNPYDETPEQLAGLMRHFPTPRDAVDTIMNTFPIVRRKDEARYGEYRTKRVILEIFDQMQNHIH
jgi:hypothetical protein